MKKGDVYESPGGMSFEVTKVTKSTITCDVQRTYRDKDKKMELRVNTREVPVKLFPTFARAYKKVD